MSVELWLRAEYTCDFVGCKNKHVISEAEESIDADLPFVDACADFLSDSLDSSDWAEFYEDPEACDPPKHYCRIHAEHAPKNAVAPSTGNAAIDAAGAALDEATRQLEAARRHFSEVLAGQVIQGKMQARGRQYCD